MGRLDTQRVSKILVYAREQKIIDSHDIVDESRPLHEVQSWGNLDAFARTIQHAYRKDYWQSQPYYVQVWSEKSTVGGVIRPITDKYTVPFMAVHGFSSYTVLNDLAEGSGEDDRQWVMLYVGDFDPSGMYMSEHDIPQRTAKYNGKVTIRRIALREDDLRGLPDFPAKCLTRGTNGTGTTMARPHGNSTQWTKTRCGHGWTRPFVPISMRNPGHGWNWWKLPNAKPWKPSPPNWRGGRPEEGGLIIVSLV